MASTLATRERYWRHWTTFLPPNIDPYLQNLAPAKRLLVLHVFARWVREGKYGRGQQVKTGSVQTALGAIGKTIELAGYENPLHRLGTTSYHAALALQTETYRREDPVTKKQLAVPVHVPNYIYSTTRKTSDRRLKATGELTLIAFFFLLRIGEYTHHGKSQRRTQQFRLGDIKLFANGQEIQPTQLAHQHPHIDLASLTIDNQKNGKRGETMSHHTIQEATNCCPVQALVQRVKDLCTDGATPATLICAFKEAPSLPWQFVRSQDIVKAVQDAIPAMQDNTRNFDKARIGSHSLRAGRATAMFLNDFTAVQIQRAGRWTTTTFLDYIHGQLAATTAGVAQGMARPIPFLNMAT